MSEQKDIKPILEKIEQELKEEFKPKIEHHNQSNPIYKKMAMFRNEKIGNKFSIKDLFGR